MLTLVRSFRPARRRRPSPSPSRPDRDLSSAERALRRGRRHEARRLAMAVTVAVRDDPRMLNCVGDLFARLDAPDSAVACYLAAADLHLEDGFHPQASALYRKILRLDPGHVVARARLAGLYHAQGLAAEAARYSSASTN